MGLLVPIASNPIAGPIGPATQQSTCTVVEGQCINISFLTPAQLRTYSVVL